MLERNNIAQGFSITLHGGSNSERMTEVVLKCVGLFLKDFKNRIIQFLRSEYWPEADL
jgi:hypothetical protein